MNKKMQSCILIVILTTPVCSGLYISSDKLDFSDAKKFCELRNQSLMVAPTYDEYSIFEQRLNDNEFIPDEFWIGVYRPIGAYEYQWVNGKSLHVYWNYLKLDSLIQKRCVVVHAKNGLWKTKECDKNTYYVCVDYAISAIAYTLYTRSVNYTTARQNCQNIGQDLVMIKNKLQHDALKMFLKLHSLGVWIGLVGFGVDEKDYRKFRWIDGNYLNTVDGLLTTNGVLVWDQRCVSYNKGTGTWNDTDCFSKIPYVCTDGFSESVRDETAIFYILIENKKPYTDPLKIYTFSSKSKCATECSKSVDCYMFTHDGLNCQLYEKSTILTKNDVLNRKLYLRRL